MWGKLSYPGLVNFGQYDPVTDGGYSVIHLPFFILLGILGGLLGALSNLINHKVFPYLILLIYLVNKFSIKIFKFKINLFLS